MSNEIKKYAFITILAELGSIVAIFMSSSVNIIVKYFALVTMIILFLHRFKVHEGSLVFNLGVSTTEANRKVLSIILFSALFALCFVLKCEIALAVYIALRGLYHVAYSNFSILALDYDSEEV